MLIKISHRLLSYLTPIITIVVMAISPLSVLAITQPYTPGQTLNPACSPGEANCTVVISSGSNTQDYFVANSTTSSSTFAGLVNVNSLNITSSTTTSTLGQIEVSSIKLGTLSGVLQVIGGYIVSALVDLASQVTGILGISNGGTGTSTAPLAGQLLLGNASGTYDLVATSSLGIVSSQWVSSSSDIYFNTGNIGISAVSDIGSKLTIESSTTTSGDATLRFQNKSGNISPGDAIGNLEFYAKDPSTSGKGLVAKISGVAGSSGNNPFTGGGRPGDLAFYVTNSGVSAVLYERMRLSSSGNLGIGNPNPGRNLDINSNSGSNTLIGLSQDLSEKLIFGLASDAGSILSGSIAGDTIFRATSTQKIMFGVSSTSSAVPALTISSANSVGIGTSTPSQKLTIAGNQYLTGAFFDGSYASGTAGMLLQTTGTSTNWVATSSLGIISSQWISSSSDIYYSAGKVGVGVSSGLSAKLNVLGTSSFAGPVYSLFNNTNKPTVIYSTGFSINPGQTAISGRYAYVLGSNRMAVMDVSNPSSPVQVATSSDNVGSGPIAISGRYAYIINNSSSTFNVVDISNPLTPINIASTTVGSNPQVMAISGHYAYVSDYNGFIFVIDISNPLSPVNVATTTLYNGASGRSLAISGRYLYVQDSNFIDIIDIINPLSPIIIGRVSIQGPFNMTISGHYAYLADPYSSALRIVDISKPSSTPSSAQIFIGANDLTSVSVSGRYAYVSTMYHNIYVVDVSDPLNPVIINNFGPNSRYMTIFGRYAFVSHYSSYSPYNISIVDLQGAEFTSAQIGSLEVNKIQVLNDLDIQGNANIRTSLSIGVGGIISNGPLSVSATTTPSYFGGSVGIGTSSPAYALDVFASTTGVIARFNNSTNNTNCTLTASGGTISCTSDERLKKNISQLSYGLADIMNLQPVVFNWKSDTDGSTSTLGFIAQDVEKVLPQLVSTDEVSGYKSLSQIGMIPIIVNAIKQIGSFINKIENGIAYLKNIVIERLTIGSAEKPTGITIYDKNGQPGCLFVDDINTGVTKVTPGACGILVPAVNTQPDSISNSPIIDISTTTPEVATTTLEVSTTTDPILEATSSPQVIDSATTTDPVFPPADPALVDPAPVDPAPAPVE